MTPTEYLSNQQNLRRHCEWLPETGNARISFHLRHKRIRNNIVGGSLHMGQKKRRSKGERVAMLVFLPVSLVYF